MVGLVHACALGVFLGLVCALDSIDLCLRSAWFRLAFHFAAMWDLGRLGYRFFQDHRRRSAQMAWGLGMSLCREFLSVVLGEW